MDLLTITKKMVLSRQAGHGSFDIIGMRINICFVAYLVLGCSFPQFCSLEVWSGLMEPHHLTL